MSNFFAAPEFSQQLDRDRSTSAMNLMKLKIRAEQVAQKLKKKRLRMKGILIHPLNIHKMRIS